MYHYNTTIEDNRNTAVSLRNLAGLLYTQREYDEAEPLYRRKSVREE
jgi:hypothetical protein